MVPSVSIRQERAKPLANVKDMHLLPRHPRHNTVTTRQAGHLALPRLVDPLLPPSLVSFTFVYDFMNMSINLVVFVFYIDGEMHS